MPTPSKGPRMGGSPAHERLMLANLATALFEHGRITTTETKAKRLRPYAEHLITFGKRGDLHARRQVLKRLNDKTVVHTLFEEIGPRYADRPGGYTRIVKLGPRKGDNAPMALIELVEGRTVAQAAVGEAERARGTQFAGSRPVTGATAESAEELAAVSPTAAGVSATAAGQQEGAGQQEAPVEETAVDDAALPAETADEGPLNEQVDEIATVADEPDTIAEADDAAREGTDEK